MGLCVQRSASLGAMHLVGRQGQIINRKVGYVYIFFVRHLYGIAVKQDGFCPAYFADFLNRPQDSCLVVGAYQRDKGGVRPDGFLQAIEIQAAIFRHGKDLKIIALGLKMLQGL